MKAVVVGAGFAGLSAGYRLQRAGWEVTVLESGAEVGGRVHSFRKDGYTVEAGATQISTGYQEYFSLMHELGIEKELLACSNVVAILHRGRLYEIDGRRPLKAILSKLLGLRAKFLMLRTIRDYLGLDPHMNVLDVSASHAIDTESASAYCDRRLNREIYDALVDPVIRAYTLNRGDQVSVVEWFSTLRNLAGQTFLALRGGNQRMPEAIAATLDVHTGAAVTDVGRTNSGVEINYVEKGQTIRAKADACVIATRLPEAIALAPAIAHVAGPLADALHYNRGVLVHLGYARTTRTKAVGMLLSAAENPYIGLVWLEHNKDPNTAPAGHSLITCYFEESGLDALGISKDAAFIKIAADFIAQVFPELPAGPDMTEISRWPLAIPNPAPGIYKAIHQMKQRINPADPIQLAGDYFTCTGQNSAIYWGRKAAENVLGRRLN